jgi:Uma2 family endonuclease
MGAKPKPSMTPAEFLLWAEQQEEDYEFVGGRPVAMSRDRAGHNVTKRAAVRALEDAIRRAGLSCTPYSDGIAVQNRAGIIRRPDASVDCTPFDPDLLVLQNPVVVVEVVSPSSERTDTGDKLFDYFAIPSIAHYLIVYPERRIVLHHARNGPPNDQPAVLTSIRSSGELVLDPPGMRIALEDLFAAEMPLA